jgi:hypothetical protein
MVKKPVFGAAPFPQKLDLRDYINGNMMYKYRDHITLLTFPINGFLIVLLESENPIF